jgi:NAD-dependent SIR2 family protein deacetylase
VDGQFQKAGFEGERIVECHGSIHHFQCVVPCSDELWDGDKTVLCIDETSFRALNRCPNAEIVRRWRVQIF